MNSNFDPIELAKFTDQAHAWWDSKNRSYGALHAINELRLTWIDRIANLQGKEVLDVGCGGGILSESMAKLVRSKAKFGSVQGIDLGAESLQVAKLHALESRTAGVHYRLIDAESLALEQPGSFDIVTCMEMLEHVPRPRSVVQACANLVKPGGWVFFSTISRNPKSFIHAIIGAEYLLGLIPRGTHEYVKFIRPSELAVWAQEAKLFPQTMQGLSYHLLTKRYSLSPDTSVNYMMATQKHADIN